MEKDFESNNSSGYSKQEKQINNAFPHQKVSTHSAYTRQASLYGIQFQSKVALFQRGHSKSVIESLNLDSLPRQDIFRKVYSFLDSLIVNPKLQQQLSTNFRLLNEEMDLLVRRSKNSIPINHSSFNNSSQRQFLSNKSEQKHDIKDLFIGFCDENQHISLKLVKAPTSSMSKSNRISIVDSMNMSELSQCLKQISPLQAIDSTNSINQNDEPLQTYQAKNNIKFESQDSVKSEDSGKNWVKLPAQKKEKAKKISIMLMEDSDSNSDSTFFSQEQTLSLSQLAPSNFPFNVDIVEAIFESPSPFLINLAVCLLLKCLAYSKLILTSQNAGWMLCISTVIAFKIYYDQPIEGLVSCFSQILGVKVNHVVHLQRWFLQELSYEVVISTNQYQQIMFRLLNQQ